ncbi:MAG TPA: sigma 54-interacting transcriptional regulator [Thermoanaerobaculia bacterium]|nr:sigma 54-interacting transcriptional regulator [Thermoanaerobaculia bacterium]
MTRRGRSVDLPAEQLRHEALDPPSEGVLLTGLGEAGRSDRQRMALLLEAVALLAHLTHARWHLADGWEGAGVDRDGRLRVRGARPGACRLLPQEHLRELVARLFGAAAGGHRSLAGRGPVRRAVRALERRWWQTLAAVDVDSAVAAVVDEASFLWQPPFAAARRSLAAEHVRQGEGGLWVVGSGAARRRFLASARDLDSLRAALAAPDAGRRWLAAATVSGVGPAELAAAGRWRAAVAAWRLSPPADDAGILRLAAAWLALGRAERALEALDSLEVAGSEAEVLRATCLSWLGRLRAARRAVKRAEELAPTADLAVSLAEVAVRNEANRGDPGAGRRRALALLDTVRRGPAGRRARARLIAAQAAWDAGDPGEMEKHLAVAERLTAAGEVDWRWLQVRALLHLERGEPDEAIDRLVTALGRRRRSLRRFEAAGLWNDLGVARGRAGDLAGAERALLHALRLHQACDGSRATTLGLANLAEVRLRRGRLLGVEEILAATSAANRAAGNLRGTVSDRLLAARFELVHGDCKAALALLGEAIGLAERRGFAGQLGEARVLSARALGWLGRSADAAAELAATAATDLEHLEPEERPAVLALAGRRDEALAAAVRIGTLGEPWLAALTAAAAPPSWKATERLEPYRTARLVADLERFASGSVPSPLRRRAIATFRRLGAGREADRLEAREHGSWQALAAYLGGSRDGPALADLFADAGYAEARLWWECEDDARVLVSGPGGGEEVSAVVADGRLVLRAPQVDPPLASLFRLARADWEGRPAAMSGDRQRAGDGSSAITVGEGGSARRPASGIVGSSPELVAALRRAERLAPGELPLLVLGESGTGKELVARLIHRSSRRRDRPLVAVNCAALSETLVLSDLFGHTRGAFTGAERDRAGVFETADGGTVFLDEIGDLPATAQGMLLRVLQEGEVRRVGESLPRRIDVRVVAATHRDLAGMVAAGSFREDLFYRLQGAAIELPPLRARGADVVALAEHLLAGVADRLGPDVPLPRLAATAANRLLAHSWPGNVRELENVLGVAAALAAADGGTILPEHLELPSSSAGDEDASCYHARVDALRRRLVAEALDAAGGVQAEAARRLGLSRQAMSYLVRRLGV